MRRARIEGRAGRATGLSRPNSLTGLRQPSLYGLLGPSGRLAGLLCLLLASPQAAAVDDAASEFDLMGTWYVLVHYKDAEAGDPDADRWEDRVWVFGKKGSRLSWTDYSTVVFANAQGRFERTLSGELSRVLAAWEPSEAQRAEIAAGLEVKSIGSRTKTLRGSRSKGYRSVGGLRSQSVSVIGYHETWSIEGLSELPVFTRRDLMGSGRTSEMEGRTQFTGTQVLEGGALVRGSYERDDARRGEFRMLRAGDVSKGRKSKKPARKRPYLTVFHRPEDKRAIAELLSSGDPLGPQASQELSEQLHASIGRTLERHGLKGAALVQRTESLSSQIEALLLEQAKTPDEVEAMVREGRIQP